MFEILLLLGLTAGGLALFERLKLPAIAGFLAAGAIAGPGILGLVPDSERVRALAEIGVVFLLFEIGLELPVDRLRRLWRGTMIAGTSQVVITLAVVATVAVLSGFPLAAALVLGGGVAMSSTALVMRLLSEQGQVDSPHGQLTVSILILQDLSVVPLLLAIPLLAAGAGSSPSALAFAIGKLVVGLAVVFAVVRFIVPRLLTRAAKARSNDLFSLIAVLVVLGSAFFAEELGLTLAVGAFLAGVSASTSPYAQQLFSEVVPLRGVFLGVFFTAVGMLFDPMVLAEHPGFVAAYLAAVLFVKGGVIAAANALLLRQSARIGVMAGLTLSQTGEFTFVLAAAAEKAGLIEPWLHQGVIAGSIVSLIATPFLIRVAPSAGDWVAGSRGSDGGAPGDGPATSQGSDGGEEDLRPVVIIGFGPAGQTLSRLLRSLDIPYVVVDANASSAEAARARGETAIFGDATRPQLLRVLDVANARLVVVAISDALATRRIVSRIRTLSRDVPVLARTRYVREVDPLDAAGATTVVAEEFESSIELVARTLQLFKIPEASIQRFTEALREGGYDAIRGDVALGIDPWLVEILQEVDAQWIDVPYGLAGPTSLAELDVRAETGASILAISRGGTTTANPPPQFDLRGGDRLLVLGDATILSRLEALLAARSS